MDPVTLAIIALVGLGSFGAYYYVSHKAAPRTMTLDSGLSDNDRSAIISAVMTGKDPAVLDGMAAQYSAYPYAAYELSYKAWQLRGSVGAPPAAPTTPGNTAPSGAAPAASNGTVNPTAAAAVAQAAANAAAQGMAPAAGPPPGVPTPPFDFSAASTHLAWQNNKTYITNYQGALRYLAWKMSKPAFDPVKVDGYYGTDTKNAVKAFQSWAGLTPVDGSMGKDSAAALTRAVSTGADMTMGRPDIVNAPHPQHTGADPMGWKGPYMTEQQEEVMGVTLPESVIDRTGETELVSGGFDGGLPASKVDRTGETELVSGNTDEMLEMGGAVDMAGAVVSAALSSPVVLRPKPNWYVVIRPSDSGYPRSLAEIGSGVKKGGLPAMRHLVDLNPHLSRGGVLPKFSVGTEVNIPPSWASNLLSRGFKVVSDSAGRSGV